MYDASKVNERCAVNSCKMVCPDCELCSHQYTCSCVDFLLRTNISKHIQLVAQCLSKKKRSSVPETNFPNMIIEILSINITLKSEHREKENGNCNATFEVNLLGNMASSSRDIGDFQCLKSKTEGYALESLNQIKSCTEFDKEALLHTAKQFCSLKNTMISLKKHKHTKALISNYHTPFNKSVETQR